MPDALAFQRRHDWDGVRARCKELAAYAQREIGALAGTTPYHPARPEWYGQIVCARLPPATDDKVLLRRLRYDYGIDVSVDRFDDQPRIRVSIQGYNDVTDVERLLSALRALL